MRELRARRNIARVGDQISRGPPKLGIVGNMTHELSNRTARTAIVSRAEAANLRRVVVRPVAAVRVGTVPRGGHNASWTLFVTPELVAEAQRLLVSKHVEPCACCGRAARVARIVIKPEPPWTAQWRDAARCRHERMRP
jgi:hypothetical protein